MEIKKLQFKSEEVSRVSSKWFGKNWPVVYIIHNHSEAYIGETTSINARMRQHMENNERRRLTQIEIIADESFNKSAVLDIESKLIAYMSSDKVYELQNSNSGMRNHNYYQKDQYEALFRGIWKELRHNKIVKHDLRALENSDLFKYTPYKSLTEEQYEVVYRLASDLLNAIVENQPATFIVNGEAGTGKTVLAMYLMKLIADRKITDFVAEEDELLMEKFEGIRALVSQFKIALVVPMGSLRTTLKQVVSKVSGLSGTMVIGPADVVKDRYDLLIVDESHRLKRRVNLTSYKSFDDTNRKLGLGSDGTELDWIMMSSRYQILFYDASQSIRPTDIRKEKFIESIDEDVRYNYHIASQLRSLGGNDYIDYVKKIFSDYPPEANRRFENYEFLLFESIRTMKEVILEKDKQFGLSRLVAGYAWKWNTKHYSLEEIERQGIFDLEIQGERMIWNQKPHGWINSANAANEVGSIHTTQGYDLNYVGVIIGPEITYNQALGRIEVIKDQYYDANGKRSIVDEQELHDYIVNVYSVLMTRAIHGTYVFVCDDALRNHLMRFIDTC